MGGGASSMSRLEVEPDPADQDGLLAGADLDLAGVVEGHHDPEAHQDEPHKAHPHARPGPGRAPPARHRTILVENVHDWVPEMIRRRVTRDRRPGSTMPPLRVLSG